MFSKVFFPFFEGLIRNIGGPLGYKIRYWYYKKRLGKCGKGVRISEGVIITSPKDVYLDDNVWIDKYVVILTGKPSKSRNYLKKTNTHYNYREGELHIQQGTHVAEFVVLQAHGGMLIKEKTGVASGAKIYTLSHHYRNLNNREDGKQYYFTPMVSDEEQFLIASPVVIGAKTAVGLNSVVLPGTHIPDGTWLGVNSFISGLNIDEQAIYSSSPAEKVKQIQGLNL
jgi:acetyltransferase-like isoleucine patch superfamily enzyme